MPQLTDTVILTFDQVLSPYVYVFFVAYMISFIFTPVMRSVAMYWNVIDRPDALRKMHSEPVAYLGGVAVFLGWIAGLASSQFLLLHTHIPFQPHVIINPSIVVAACVILVLGLWDDLRKISPWIKIAGQVAAAVIVLSSGVGEEITEKFIVPINERLINWYGWRIMPDVLEILIRVSSGALVIAVIVFCSNATNLMDGLDGLCGGVTGIITTGLLLLAVYLGMESFVYRANDDALRVVLALALLGGVLGFVPYNFNPASIFMGDTGSMFLGFMCGLLIILMGDVANRWFLAATVMFALPILDTGLAFARRWVNRRPVFSADKHHFHHQLVARGLTVRKAVVLLYVLAIVFVVCGIAIVFMRTRYASMFYMVIFCSIIVAAYKMGMVHEKPSVVTRRPLGAEPISSAPPPQIDSGSILEVREKDEQSPSI